MLGTEAGLNTVFAFFLFFKFLATSHGMWDLSSLTRDQTCAPCSGSAESEPLDRQGSPTVLSLKGWWGPSLLESPQSMYNRWPGLLFHCEEQDDQEEYLSKVVFLPHDTMPTSSCSSFSAAQRQGSLSLSGAFPAPPPKFQLPAVISDTS